MGLRLLLTLIHADLFATGLRLGPLVAILAIEGGLTARVRIGLVVQDFCGGTRCTETMVARCLGNRTHERALRLLVLLGGVVAEGAFLSHWTLLYFHNLKQTNDYFKTSCNAKGDTFLGVLQLT